MAAGFDLGDPKLSQAGADVLFAFYTGRGPAPQLSIAQTYEPFSLTANAIAKERNPRHHIVYPYESPDQLAVRGVYPRSNDRTFLMNGKPRIEQVYPPGAARGMTDEDFYSNLVQPNMTFRATRAPLLVVPPKGRRHYNAAAQLFLDSDFIGTVVLPYDYANAEGWLEEGTHAFVDYQSYASTAVEISTHEFDNLQW